MHKATDFTHHNLPLALSELEKYYPLEFQVSHFYSSEPICHKSVQSKEQNWDARTFTVTYKGHLKKKVQCGGSCDNNCRQTVVKIKAGITMTTVLVGIYMDRVPVQCQCVCVCERGNTFRVVHYRNHPQSPTILQGSPTLLHLPDSQRSTL